MKMLIVKKRTEKETFLEPSFCPLYASCVQAGFPSPADDFLDQTISLDKHLVSHPTATFFVRVSGHSMINAGIHEGDMLIVDRSLDAKSGHIVIALIEGEFTVKRLIHQGNLIFLKAENENYPSIKIKEGSDAQIWGVVTYVIHGVL